MTIMFFTFVNGKVLKKKLKKSYSAHFSYVMIIKFYLASHFYEDHIKTEKFERCLKRIHTSAIAMRLKDSKFPK